MLKDRGRKKWNGFFMPEHVKSLREYRNDYYKTPRPQLDEGQIEEMEHLLSDSLQNKTLLEITIWRDGFFTKMVGIVTKIDPYEKAITIRDELDSTNKINFFDITNVMIL